MKSGLIGFLVAVSGVVLGVFSGVAAAETGVSSTEIIVGQSAALTGPASALGQGMRDGMLSYFSLINDSGGVHGRTIRLISYDDTYEPEECVKQTRRLLIEEVFALIGYVGTPTSQAVLPLVAEHKIPFIGAFTGADILRNPFNRYIVNVRGSYFDETEGLVQRLVEDKNVTAIACLYQNDAFGQAGLAGVRRALEKRNMKLVAEGTYERNTTAVRGALVRMKVANPQAVIMIGAYAPCAEFVRSAHGLGMTDTQYCTISFVGSEALRAEAGEFGHGIIISQVVPFPWDESLPLIREYQAALKKYVPDQSPGFVSLEGFMVAKFFVEALKAAPRELTREGFIDTVEQVGTFDMGGVALMFGPQDHQGMDDILFTRIESDGFKQISRF